MPLDYFPSNQSLSAPLSSNYQCSSSNEVDKRLESSRETSMTLLIRYTLVTYKQPGFKVPKVKATTAEGSRLSRAQIVSCS